ncbi:hypothetical protein FDP41_009864 [Naegleria fowleri]|uniref:Uncharacterized protein n=1 Tax=Naegleria fowleri TaxID=5763 RepID=A0A6A5B9F3_NAEFO|nr:uncharacterized protein FDP41_009864 [Naegleria fowleri]KAF0971641.1 hypothetical protein FDP41_009864 [Naegleria fowleri]CAG4712152.1 unnamed protein product [Naegleria fowleri]
MGCFGDSGSKSTTSNNKTKTPNNNNAGNASKKDPNRVSVLLLGAGESGKSTIFKQMKIIHKEPFTDEERATFREIIYGNIVRNMRALIEACENLEIPIQKNESKRIASEFMQRMDDDALLNIERHWTPELANDIQFLWTKEEAIQQAFAKRNLFQITDSAAYYFNAMDRIKDPSSYLPSVDDVLRSRLKTTGIAEMEFHLKEIGKIVKVIDVGGQRNERKKWIHCFEGVDALLYVSSLSEYNQLCYEDESTQRLNESLYLFEDVCNNRWFKDTDIILFLNKTDVFKEKIETLRDLSKYQPEYTGNDYESAREFIKNKFLEKNHNAERNIYTEFTCAVETENLGKQFVECISKVLQKRK